MFGTHQARRKLLLKLAECLLCFFCRQVDPLGDSVLIVHILHLKSYYGDFGWLMQDVY